MHVYDAEATAAGIDASRRVAWARYYGAVEDSRALLRQNAHLMRHVARLALKVVRSEAVRVLDPDLHAEAGRVLAALRARSRGRAIVESVEREGEQ